jgi:hypothetical protein
MSAIIDEVVADVRSAQLDDADRDVDAAADAGNDAGADLITFRSRTALDSIAMAQPEFLCGGWFIRELTTILSAGGGTGKSAANIQLALEMTTGRAPLGHASWCADQPLVVAYVNGEDTVRGTNYWLARYLPAYGLDETPAGFHYRHTRELTPRLLLDPVGTQQLIESLKPLAPDVVMLDTAIALLPPARNNLNPEEIRQRLEVSCTTIGMALNCGVLLDAHDNKRGDAASGPTSWTDFSRITLHLRRQRSGERESPDRNELELWCHKSNMGWPYETVRLRRDPGTLLLAVEEVRRYGEKPAETTKGGKLTELETWRRLAVAVEFEVLPKPEAERQTTAVRDFCRSRAGTYPAPTEYADRFVRLGLRFQPASDPQKRNRNAQVACAIRPESEWPNRE